MLVVREREHGRTLSSGWPPGVTLRRLSGAPPSCERYAGVAAAPLWCEVCTGPWPLRPAVFSTSAPLWTEEPEVEAIAEARG